MFPAPVDPSWYHDYWLTERAPRRRRLADALQRLALVLTEPLIAPHSRADARVSACLPSSILAALPPI
jgi:hypothetical protein